MDVKVFADEYALKADEELLLLAAASQDLTEEARTALADELARRGVQPPPPPAPVPRPVKIVVPAGQSAAHRREASRPWQVLWFFLHLVIVYFVVMFFSWRIAYVVHSVLGAAVDKIATASLFDFFVSHLFLFSLVPGFIAGLAIARFNARAAKYVWVVPAAVVALRISIFPAAAGSVLFGRQQSHWWTVLQYFFVTDLADVTRGLTQMRITVPLYAAIAYSGAAIVAARSQLHEAIDRAFDSSPRLQA